MSLTPPSTMHTPWNLLRQTATITPKTTAQSSAGDFTHTDGTTYTVKCNLQPNGSSEAMLLKRETGITSYVLFLAPINTAGTAVSIGQIDTVTIDSIDYRVVGVPMDLCSHGAVFMLNLERNT